MVEFSLAVGNPESDLLETAVVLFSLTNMLQWCFFIVFTTFWVVKYIKNENAPTSHKKHSRNHYRKGR